MRKVAIHPPPKEVGVFSPILDKLVQKAPADVKVELRAGTISVDKAYRQLNEDGEYLNMTGATKNDSVVENLNADKANAENPYKNEHYSPDNVIESARLILGEIDLDPASCEMANQTVKAKEFYSAADDGLKKEWRGRVWLNPPYSNGKLDPFAEKFLNELDVGNIDAAIILVDNRTDTGWFHKLAVRAGLICFTRNRIKFKHFHADGTENKNNHRNGSVFMYFGNAPAQFNETFSEYGFICRAYKETNNDLF